MILSNETVFPTFIFSAYGRRDQLNHVFICRGTFDILRDGRITLANEQQPVLLADKYRTAPLVSSVEVDTDLVPLKFATDITVNAVAHAKNLEPKEVWPVRLAVGSTVHTLQVTGPRHWHYSILGGWRLSNPEPTTEVPLQYEYAYGGRYRSSEGEFICEQNPVGRGFVDRALADKEARIAAPQVELPTSLVSRLGTRYEVAGWGPIAKHWLPRRSLCGTPDQKWKDSRWPLRPLDFDFRYYNSAPSGLIHDGFLRGDERIQISGVDPYQDIEFRLPGIAITLFVIDEKHRFSVVNMKLDTLHIDTVTSKCCLTWRASFPQTVSINSTQIVQEFLARESSSFLIEARHG